HQSLSSQHLGGLPQHGHAHVQLAAERGEIDNLALRDLSGHDPRTECGHCLAMYTAPAVGTHQLLSSLGCCSHEDIFCTLHPPSTVNAVPVMNEASSLARN